jgi:hypothetical protein
LGFGACRLAARVCHLLFPNFVENSASVNVDSGPQDITFACAHCASPLVVDSAAAGMSLPCQKCGKPTVVPDIPTIGSKETSEADAKMAELRRQLKENESQRTEITGYINQHSIQLHRWKLRLQTLNERKEQLDNELRAAK